MKLRLTPRALGDLRRIADHLEQRNPQGARNVGRALQAGLRVVADHPLSGRLRRNGVRSFVIPRYPYLIFYRLNETAGEIEVFSIRHAARRQDH